MPKIQSCKRQTRLKNTPQLFEYTTLFWAPSLKFLSLHFHKSSFFKEQWISLIRTICLPIYHIITLNIHVLLFYGSIFEWHVDSKRVYYEQCSVCVCGGGGAQNRVMSSSTYAKQKKENGRSTQTLPIRVLSQVFRNGNYILLMRHLCCSWCSKYAVRSFAF